MAWFIKRETATLLTLYKLLEEVPHEINYHLWEVVVSFKLRRVLKWPLFLSRNYATNNRRMFGFDITLQLSLQTPFITWKECGVYF